MDPGVAYAGTPGRHAADREAPWSVPRTHSSGEERGMKVTAETLDLDERAAVRETVGGSYQELARIIERLHRRFLDVIRVELSRMGIDDISQIGRAHV